MPETPRYHRFFRLFSGADRAEQEMDEELEAHLRLSADEYERRGATPADARRMAEARFGDLVAARQRLRMGARQLEQGRQRRDRLGAILADLRFALVQVRRAPGFSLLAVGTLALGIGLTTATFSLVNGVLLRPLALEEPRQLVSLASRDSMGREFPVVSAGNWSDWRASSRALEDAAIHAPRPMALGTSEGATRVLGQLVSGNFFSVLRPEFLLGRGFHENEVAQQQPVVVISEALWRQLGSDSVLATPLRVDGVPHQVLGVVRGGSEYPAATMVWGGVLPGPEFGAARNNVNWYAIGRMKPGLTQDQVRDDLDRVAGEIRARIPEALYSYGVGVVPLQQFVVGDADRMLKLLMLAVSAVLLVACANLAAANLGRGAGRSREFAVRVALGAGRARLVQQVLVEQGLLALTGGLVGSWVGWLAVRSVLHSWAGEIPRAADVTFDPRVLLFAVGVSVLAGVLAGISPALRSSQVSPHAVMSGGTRTASGGRGLPGAWLIAGEIALALMLLTGAGLLLRSFDRLLSRELGFSTSVVTAEAGLSRVDFASPDLAAQYWGGVMAELRTIPGVQSVGVGTWVPLASGGSTFIEIGGRELSGQGAQYRIIGGDYFDALEVPLIAGRTFDERDARGAARAVVINQRMAEEYWPGVDPIGQQVRAVSMEQGPPGVEVPWLTVIGVVGNVRHWGMEAELQPEMYVDYRQVPWWAYGMTALVRGSLPATELTRIAQVKLRAHSPNVAFAMGTLQERLDRSLANRRFAMSVLTGFSALALVLAAIGLYAVLAYSVARRTRELAVRSALGASRSSLMRLVFANAARVVLSGVAIGVVGAVALGRSMRALLFDVPPFDPASFAGAALVLILVSGVAVLFPALRATRSDPVSTLQSD